MSDQERIRTVAVIASSGLGGAERAFATVLQGLDPDRFDVWVACHGTGPMAEVYRQRAHDVWSLDLLNVGNLSTAVRLARRMRQVRCQLVITCMWTADVLGGLAAAIAGVPLRVATVQGEHFQLDGHRGWHQARRRLLSRTFRSIYRLFDQVIAVSQAMADDLSRRPGVRVSPARLTVIPNGIDLSQLPGRRDGVSREALGVPPQALLVTAVANFMPNKGHQWLVQAMPRVLARVPEAVFVLVGDGPERPKIERWIGQAGVQDRVRLLGVRQDAPAWLALSDVVVVPSASAEGTPLAIMEALALGRPVVSTRVGGIPELIEHGRTGLLVPPRDAEALGEAVAELLVDRGRAGRLGAAGLEAARTRFTHRRMVEQTEQLYLRLAAERGLGGGES